MCGYVALYCKDEVVDKNLIKRVTEEINHRGPDDTGYFIKDNIALGFKRLSIIDLKHGHQPMAKGKKAIVFNGEIYNHKELRNNLISKGYKFETESDTEVLFNYYIEYKEKCVDDLRGMFSFIVYDEKEKKIFGARDHFGIKPLYYINNDKYIAFSSEYKALLSLMQNVEVNEEALQNYLSFQFTPQFKTMIKGINEVPNGTYFSIDNGELKFKKYHEIEFVEGNIKKEDVLNVVKDSVKKHMLANVEVGTFLSGGIDSTITTALAAQINPKIKSFSVGFDVDGYNELEVAKKSANALGVENIQIKVTEQDYIEALPRVIYSMDDPLADPSCVGIYFLSREARRNNVKVVLSGEGADELFGGYNIYKEYYSVKPLFNLPKSISSKINKFADMLPEVKGKSYLTRATTPLRDRYIGNAKIFDNKEVSRVTGSYNKNNNYSNLLKDLYDNCEERNYDYISTMQYIDMNTWLEGDILLKADKMSMANSIELRVPFLDKEVLNIAEKLKLEQKVTKDNTKVLLREAFKDIVPNFMVEKKKLGFPTPIRVWLKSDLGIYVRDIISKAKVDDIINKEYSLELLDEHIAGKKDNSRKVWTIFAFCLWHAIFIEGISLEELEGKERSKVNFA